MFLSKYGVARHVFIPVVKRGVVDFAVGADWTPAAGDVKISKDGAAAANVTNLPAAIAMGNGAIWDFSLTATEMQAAQVVVTVADAATKAVEDQSLIVETYGNASAQHALDLSINQTGDNFARLGAPAGASHAADIAAVKGVLPAALVGGRIDASVGAVASGVIAAAAFAAGALDAVWSTTTRLLTAGTNIVLAKGTGVTGLNDLDAPGVRNAVGLASANLDTQLGLIAGYIDTEVAAIKAKTDNLPASPAAVGSAMTLTSGERTAVADAMLDETSGVETGLTVRAWLRLAGAMLFGKVSGGQSGTETFRAAVSDSKARVVVSDDSAGNRTAVSTDAT